MAREVRLVELIGDENLEAFMTDCLSSLPKNTQSTSCYKGGRGTEMEDH